MNEIKLTENIVTIKIGTLEFQVDCDDITKHRTMSEFVEAYKGNRLSTDSFIHDCKYVIETILGNGSYGRLFKKDDLKPYYAILQIYEIIQERFEDHATTDKMRENQRTMKEEVANIQKIVGGMSDFSKQMDYTKGKYGMKNVANKRRTSKNHRN